MLRIRSHLRMRANGSFAVKNGENRSALFPPTPSNYLRFAFFPKNLSPPSPPHLSTPKQTPDDRQRTEGGRCGAAGAMALVVKTTRCVGGLEARAVIIVPNTAGAKNLRAGPWCPHETGLRMPGSRGLYPA